MKLLLIRLQILFIVLLVFSPLLYLTYQKFAPNLELLMYDFAQKDSFYPPISPLHTQGRDIVDQNNNKIILRGVNLISTNWGQTYDGWNPDAIGVAARDWKINVIRTRIYQNEFEQNPANFFLTFEKEILIPAKNHSLYVVVHPWFSENQSLPDNIGVKMWLSFAARYKNDPHIIYDLLAEPRDITFAELKNTYTALIPKIRSISPNSLIMVTGLDWGRDINAWLDDPLPYDNLIYRSNPYNNTAEFPAMFGKIAEVYPVFLGEFGTDQKLSMTEKDVQDILGYADAAGLGWTAWHFTSTGCPCLLTDDRNFIPSSYGQIVKDNLNGKVTPFTLPTFNDDPNRLYVYSDFLDSGFADYSWGLTTQMGQSIKTTMHPGAGLYLNTSRRLDPGDFQFFSLTLETTDPTKLSLRFKSWDNQLSRSFNLVNGENIIRAKDIDLPIFSALIIEGNNELISELSLSLDNLYFTRQLWYSPITRKRPDGCFLSKE